MPKLSMLLVLWLTACGTVDPEGMNPGECADGADNDGDGEYDCDDTDCGGSPDCQPTTGTGTGAGTGTGTSTGTGTGSGTGTGTTSTTVDPHDTTFPLAGAHALDCGACHGGSGYGGLNPACASCHEVDRPPYHYVEDCAQCHPVTVWADGVIHAVPLPHHAADCSSCHPDAANYQSFTCTTGCHAEAATDSLHAVVVGYVYDSANCAMCHFP